MCYNYYRKNKKRKEMIVMERKKHEYTILIKEILEKRVKVFAESEQDAYQIADELYDNEDVVLTPEDFTRMDMQIVDKK